MCTTLAKRGVVSPIVWTIGGLIILLLITLILAIFLVEVGLVEPLPKMFGVGLE